METTGAQVVPESQQAPEQLALREGGVRGLLHLARKRRATDSGKVRAAASTPWPAAFVPRLSDLFCNRCGTGS